MSLVGTRPILPDELEQYELHHRAIKNLLDVAFQHDADVVAGNYRTVNEDGRLCREYKNYSLREIKPEGNLHGQPWGKVYKGEGHPWQKYIQKKN